VAGGVDSRGTLYNIQTSTDGVNFTPIVSGGLDTSVRTVFYDGLYVWAGGVNSDTNNVIYSTDGLTWSFPRLAGAANGPCNIAVNSIFSSRYPRVLLIAGEDSNGAATGKFSGNFGSTYVNANIGFTAGAGAGGKGAYITGSGRAYLVGASGGSTFRPNFNINAYNNWAGPVSNFTSCNGVVWNGTRGYAVSSSGINSQRIVYFSPNGTGGWTIVTNTAGVGYGIMRGVDSLLGYTLAVGDQFSTATDAYRIATNDTVNFGIPASAPGFTGGGYGAYIVRLDDNLLEVGNSIAINPQPTYFNQGRFNTPINAYADNITSIGDVIFINNALGTLNTSLGIFKQPDTASFPVDVAAPVRIVNTLTVTGTLTASGTAGVVATVVRIGTIASPTLNLQLQNDSAGKPTTNTWTIVSDNRIKKNIVLADLDRCYEIVKGLPLKYYEWNYPEEAGIENKDKHSLGFIAQDVEAVFPNAITTSEEDVWGIPNLKMLNTDQIIKVSHGALQKLMEKVEALEKEVADLKSKL
jgi:hypothetical protein